jgi:hypothetical protein
MGFLARLFCNHIVWRSKKVFFDENAQDKDLIKLLLFKGAITANSRETADLVIVRNHTSCWWSWKEITFADLYFYLTDADKHLYYIARLKQQHRPTRHEKIFFAHHHYMIVLNFLKKTFHVYYHDPVPFLDQKVYTKHIIRNHPYMRVWVNDGAAAVPQCVDGFLIQLSNSRYMSIGGAVCIFNQDHDEKQSSLSTIATPFLVHPKFNLSGVFQKHKTVWCTILHHG